MNRRRIQSKFYHINNIKFFLNRMDVIACVDNGYVMPTGVMAYSFCYNNQDVDTVFHFIVDESVTEKDKNDLKKAICGFAGKRAIFYQINSKKVEDYPCFSKIGPTLSSYYRLFLTEILPITIDKVLYLDGDIIVRKSLLPLWNTDISDFALAAVLDLNERNNSMRLQYDPRLGYFNSGVMLINMRYWRDSHASKLFAEFLKSHKDYVVLQDQDVLNYVFREQKHILPYEYNCIQDYASKSFCLKDNPAIQDAIMNPAIIHFAGTYKPWDAYSRFHHPYNSSFYKYQSQTKWKGCTIDRRSFNLKVKNAIADFFRKLKLLAPLENPFIDILPID